jgi:hypothetical protein
VSWYIEFLLQAAAAAGIRRLHHRLDREPEQRLTERRRAEVVLMDPVRAEGAEITPVAL